MLASDSVKLLVAIAALPPLWRLSGYLLRRYLVRKLTALTELNVLGNPRKDSERIEGAAVVCGGSISGLWTARVCADHFEEVIVIESEPWLATTEGTSPVYDEKGAEIPGSRAHERTRVMQYGACHIYQIFSLLGLRKLFPNIDKEFERRDVHVGVGDYNVHIPRGRVAKVPMQDIGFGTHPDCFFSTREAYERLLRHLVRGNPRIRWIAGTVSGINAHINDYGSVASVTVRVTDSEEDSVIPATLVADCTGPSQAGYKWLQRYLSETTAAKNNVDLPRDCLPFDQLRIKYDTRGVRRTFRFDLPLELRNKLPIPGGYDSAHFLISFLPDPEIDPRSFVLSRTEGHRLELEMTGWGESYLPDTPEEIHGWMESIKSASPIPGWVFSLIDIVVNAVKVVPRKGRIPPCNWIRYEKAAHLPSNFIAIGDATMQANPLWGQGCTKAAIGAILLDGLLRKPGVRRDRGLSPDFAVRFFRRQSDVLAGVWDGTKPADYGFETTIPVEGETLSTEWFKMAYLRLVMALAVTDSHVDSLLYHVRMFLAPPTDLMQPLVLRKVIWLLIQQTLGLNTA